MFQSGQKHFTFDFLGQNTKNPQAKTSCSSMIEPLPYFFFTKKGYIKTDIELAQPDTEENG